MEDLPPPSPTTPPAEPEAPGPKGSLLRPAFAWWGWVLFAALVITLIWFLVKDRKSVV